MDASSENNAGLRKRAIPRKATPKSLENAALHYLKRYASSSENLRRLLMRRVQRSARFHGDDVDEGVRQVNELVARFQAAGLVDDRTYAEGRARSLFRRGTSPGRIRLKLREKGVAEADVEFALAALAEDYPEPALTGAVLLARRRRLGPFRAAADREAMRNKDLASLARAGFAYEDARAVIDAETSEEAESFMDADD